MFFYWCMNPTDNDYSFNHYAVQITSERLGQWRDLSLDCSTNSLVNAFRILSSTGKLQIFSLQGKFINVYASDIKPARRH